MAIEARLTLNPDDYTAALEEASKSTENFKRKAEQAEVLLTLQRTLQHFSRLMT